MTRSVTRSVAATASSSLSTTEQMFYNTYKIEQSRLLPPKTAALAVRRPAVFLPR